MADGADPATPSTTTVTAGGATSLLLARARAFSRELWSVGLRTLAGSRLSLSSVRLPGSSAPLRVPLASRAAFCSRSRFRRPMIISYVVCAREKIILLYG